LVICWDIYPDKWDIYLKKKGWNTDPNTYDGKIHVFPKKECWKKEPDILPLHYKKNYWGTYPNVWGVPFRKKKGLFNY